MKSLIRNIHIISRTLHIYMTLLALMMILFFSISGFILNHQEWFAADTISQRTETITLPEEIYRHGDRLVVVEYLRNHAHARGQVAHFDQNEEEIKIIFTGPGRRTEAFIEKNDGRAEITHDTQGLAAILMDLHQGKGTGMAWKLILDISVGLLFLGSITGLILFLVLPRRRIPGTIALIAGTLACLAVYFLAVLQSK